MSTGLPADADGRSVCRFCAAPLQLTVVDLGMSPLCESFLPADRLEAMEPFYPLHVRACERCWLVQLPSFVPPDEIFAEYAYYSAYSTSWVEHARSYVEMIRERLALGPSDFVVELASNDGYLLQHFVGSGIPMLGIDPAANVAEAAEERGVPTLVAFFGRETAQQLVEETGQASLVVGNNVLAQVPDLNDFVAGVATLLRDDGTATFEFPHLLRLLEGLQYDTIYHEHFSYFALATTVEIMRAHGLEVYDVDELPTHGGSLRVYVQRAGGPHAARASVDALLESEAAAGLLAPARYARFAEDVQESKRALLDLLIRLRRDARHVVGYGAPGKGNTLLNYCGIRTDLLDYTVDRNPYKHGLYTPGTHIPIHPPEKIAETRPEFVVVLPWNLIDEIARQLDYVSEWGGRLVVPVPSATIV
ncbi:MAG TPA: class I SAM-dependent methyltransferase [Gaiellaceae bacterium]|nr:class I SAM-dependent methyltransferase [Gaiellaceae bacterium]